METSFTSEQGRCYLRAMSISVFWGDKAARVRYAPWSRAVAYWQDVLVLNFCPEKTGEL